MRRIAATSLVLLLACGDDASSASEGDTETDGSSDTENTGPGSATQPTTGNQGCDGATPLACAPTVEVECEGPFTDAVVPGPDLSCDEWVLTDDAPESFPPGQTNVTFDAEGEDDGATCITAVVVLDSTAPTLSCPDAGTVVLTEPGEGVPPIAAIAEDTCDESPVVEASPPILEDEGTTDVVYTATDAFGNVATCSAQVTTLAAYAVDGLRVLSASAGQASTSVTVGWEAPQSDAIVSLRLEIASNAEGPWSEIASVSPQALVHTFDLAQSSGLLRAVSVTAAGDGGATEPRPVFQVSSDLYNIPDVEIPNVFFDTNLYGVVRYPTDISAGPFPLVVALHGNHGNCRDGADGSFDYCVTSQSHECAGDTTAPNAEGYTYFLETLAAQGYIAVSISGNAMNCRDDFIFERAELIGEHLRRWSAWNDGTGQVLDASFAGEVDLGRVGLVGHSRGGDAVAHVPEVLANNPIPGVEVASVFAVAPTDFHQAEITGPEYGVLLPGCDGDVAPLSGMNHYDRSSLIDDGAQRAQVLWLGANHNFFNTEWRISEWDLFGNPNDPFCTPDDDAQKLAQTHMLESMLGAWFERTLLQPEPLEPFMQATAPAPAAFDAWAEQDLEMRWSYASPNRVIVDDFQGGNAPATNDLGGANTFTDWFLSEVCFELDCDPYFRHVKNVARLLWQLPADPIATFELLDYDASAHEALTMRVVSRRSSLNTGLEENDFFVRLRDVDGVEAQLRISDAKTLHHLYPHPDPLEVLETFSLPLVWFTEREAALDLSALAALEFSMAATGTDGSVIVSDITFTE